MQEVVLKKSCHTHAWNPMESHPARSQQDSPLRLTTSMDCIQRGRCLQLNFCWKRFLVPDPDVKRQNTIHKASATGWPIWILQAMQVICKRHATLTLHICIPNLLITLHANANKNLATMLTTRNLIISSADGNFLTRQSRHTMATTMVMTGVMLLYDSKMRKLHQTKMPCKQCILHHPTAGEPKTTVTFNTFSLEATVNWPLESWTRHNLGRIITSLAFATLLRCTLLDSSGGFLPSHLKLCQSLRNGVVRANGSTSGTLSNKGTCFSWCCLGACLLKCDKKGPILTIHLSSGRDPCLLLRNNALLPPVHTGTRGSDVFDVLKITASSFVTSSCSTEAR